MILESRWSHIVNKFKKTGADPIQRTTASERTGRRQRLRKTRIETATSWIVRLAIDIEGEQTHHGVGICLETHSASINEYGVTNDRQSHAISR